MIIEINLFIRSWLEPRQRRNREIQLDEEHRRFAFNAEHKGTTFSGNKEKVEFR